MFRNRSTRALASLGLTFILALTAMAGPAAIFGKRAASENSATAIPAPVPPATVSAVTPGANVAFDVHFKNTSSSNLAQFFLNAITPNTAQGAALVGVESSDRAGCVSGTDLHCTFGALNAGAQINLRVVYTTPSFTGPWTVPFNFSTTGVAPDTGGNSHGDDYPTPGVVNLDASLNFGGAYTSAGGQLVTDNTTLSKRQNPQYTQVNAPAALIGVTVGEQAGNTAVCPAAAGSCFGQWSVISVNHGLPYSSGFSVVIGYKGNIGNASFVHLFDGYDPVTNPTAYELIEYPGDICSDASPDAGELPCMILSSSNGDSFATLWLTQNGRLSGY